MKLLSLPIDVRSRRGRPEQLYWKGRTVNVQQIADFWILQSRWWAKEERRIYFRAETSRGLAEIYRTGQQWVLSRIMD